VVEARLKEMGEIVKELAQAEKKDGD